LPQLRQAIDLDKQRREGLQKVETLKARRNQASQEIAQQKKNKVEDTTLLDEMKQVSRDAKAIEEKLSIIETQLQALMYEFPNLLDESVPEGKAAEDNKVVRTWGKPPVLDFEPKSHDEIGEALKILDFKKAGEVSGARFVFVKGLAAKVERALIQFMLDTHAHEGYEEILPPFLVNRNTLIGTGQLPKFEEDVFRIEKFDYFLIPTAEVPVTNYHREEILEEKDLPIRYTAYTPCFRSEAGSYGKDTKGLKRQHQFNKVELVKFTTPETSFEEHEKLTANAEKILQLLGLHYRVVALCAGDTGFGSSKTYDIEVWSPASKGYMEISSCSNFADFQARRANIRYRSAATGKVHFVHTLNGSGLAVGRTLLAIIENFQTKDGTFTIPEVLKPYLNR
jgi:seryl-tRNA synthetase